MLDIDFSTIIIQMVNFLVLAILLYFLLFRRVMKSIKENAEKKELMMKKIEQDQIEAEKIRLELQSRLDSIDDAVTQVINEAQEQLDERKKEAIQEAQTEIQRMVEDSESEINHLKKRSYERYQNELVTAVLDTSIQVFKKLSIQELHDSLVKKSVERVWEMGRGDMQKVESLRRSLGERQVKVFVESPVALSPDQQRSIVQTFSALSDRNVNIEIRKEPSLAAGIRIRMGDLIVDNSIKGQVESLREDVFGILKEKMKYE